MKTEDNEDLDMILAYILKRLNTQENKNFENRLLKDEQFANEYEREKLLYEYFNNADSEEETWDKVVERYQNDEIFKQRFGLMESVDDFIEEQQIKNKQKQIKAQRGFVFWLNKNRFWLGAMAASITIFILIKLITVEDSKAIVLKESELPVYYREEKIDGLGFADFDLPNEDRITQFIIDAKKNNEYPIKYILTQDSLKLYIVSYKDTINAKNWKIEKQKGVFKLLTDSTKKYILISDGKLNTLK